MSEIVEALIVIRGVEECVDWKGDEITPEEIADWFNNLDSMDLGLQDWVQVEVSTRVIGDSDPPDVCPECGREYLVRNSPRDGDPPLTMVAEDSCYHELKNFPRGETYVHEWGEEDE